MIRSAMALAALAICTTTVHAQTPSVSETLHRLAVDYAADPALTVPVTFGIRVDGDDWTIEATPAESERASSVTVRRGLPDVAAVVFVTDHHTFNRIASGDLHSLTAMVQARHSDPTPMNVEFVNGLELTPQTRLQVISVLFHFFTTGSPEIVPLGAQHSLPAHGGQALPIYYADNLRTSWYGIAPGQHINESPEDQINDFPSLFIIIEAGTARARLGGREIVLEDNQAILVPQGMTHEFWNPGDDPATFLLIMFGDEA